MSKEKTKIVHDYMQRLYERGLFTDNPNARFAVAEYYYLTEMDIYGVLVLGQKIGEEEK